MRTDIYKLDDELCSAVQEIETFAETLVFNRLHEFEVNSKLNEFNFDLFNFQGVYLFEVYDSAKMNGKFIKEFCDLWTHPNYEKKATPSPKKKRIIHHIDGDNNWIPIYLGISKKVSQRIKAHILKKLHQRTFALKLRERENLYGIKMRLRTVELEVKNYDQILPIIERKLRDQINPIIGKQ